MTGSDVFQFCLFGALLLFIGFCLYISIKPILLNRAAIAQRNMSFLVDGKTFQGIYIPDGEREDIHLEGYRRPSPDELAAFYKAIPDGKNLFDSNGTWELADPQGSWTLAGDIIRGHAHLVIPVHTR